MASNDAGRFMVLLMFLIPIVFVIYVGASGWAGGGSSRFEDINEGFGNSGDTLGYILLGIMGLGLFVLSVETFFPRKNNSG